MNKQIAKNIVKVEKVVIKEVAFAKTQVAELGKASMLTLGNGKWGGEGVLGGKPFYTIG